MDRDKEDKDKRESGEVEKLMKGRRERESGR